MAPKKKPQPSDKNKAKARVKAADDKTFGLKNKNKSKKVQEQINQIKAGSDGGMAKKREAEAKRRAEEKKAAEEAKKEAMKLMGIQQPRVPFGTDPKTVVCEFFKHGMCDKGIKCKYSHDLTAGKKPVAAKEEEENDDDDDGVVSATIGADGSAILSKKGNPVTTTEKLCNHFIQAVEDSKFGLFWKCPNGDRCKYNHKLPPGMVLKTKEQKRLERLAAENAPKITLEDFIEMERDKLDRSTFTPITPETFAEWKKKIRVEKEKEDKKRDEKSKKLLTGKQIIMQRYADKFSSDGKVLEDSGEGEREGDEANENDEDDKEFNLAQYKKEDDGAKFMDYGDGNRDWNDIEKERAAFEKEWEDEEAQRQKEGDEGVDSEAGAGTDVEEVTQMVEQIHT